MPSQKLPLFDGIIQPLDVGTPLGTPIYTTIFDKPFNPLAPRTYEVHLWLLPALGTDPILYSVMASEGPIDTAVKKAGVWTGRTTADSFAIGAKPIKILDGYPVRGGVQLSIGCSGSPEFPYPLGPQVFGYYYQVGEGAPLSPEHRFIGNKTLSGFNAGVPYNFVVPAATGLSPSQIIHTFEPGRIDEISLALSMLGAAAADFDLAILTFEDVSNQPLIPGHQVLFRMNDVLSGPAFAAGNPPAAANTVVGIPGQETQISSPYLLLGIPFGGNPLLHHLRVQFQCLAGGPNVATAHGFFIRH